MSDVEIKCIKLKGSSMLPLFKEGEFVLYAEVKPEKISKGDCIVYSYRENLYLHRVIGKFGENFIVSNDDDIDEHIVPFKDVKGKVISSNILKNGFLGLLYHKFIKVVRKWNH